MDVFITLQLSRSLRLNHKWFSGEIKSDILTLLTLPSADVKSAVLNKVQVLNFSLYILPDSSVWSVGNLICIYGMWKGRSYVNANVSVSPTLKNNQGFFKYHFLCHRSVLLEEI